jgi:hypothetical protein
MIQLCKLSTQALSILAVTLVGAVSLSTYSASAQSTDRDRPTPITSNEIQGTLEEKSDFFYSVVAGAGDLTITVDLKPSSGSIAVATVQLYSASGNELLNTPLMPTANSSSGDRQTAKIKLPTRQKILLRITEGTGYGGNYRIRLDGAVALGTGTSGYLLKVPQSGTLRVELNNGSAQEFDLSRVNRVLVNP